MDGRDQTDTNVVRIRRKAEPSEAERKRLARTIFAEEDEVGTFSHGNLVPPPSGRSAQSRDDTRADADPYFDHLQRARGAPDQNSTAEETDSETTAYFDQLTNSAPDEMALMIDAPSAEPALPGSAHLPAESIRPTVGRKRKRSQLGAATIDTDGSASDGRDGSGPVDFAVLARLSLRRPRASWRRTSYLGPVGRRTRPAIVIVIALALALAGGATLFAMLATTGSPQRPQTVEARTSTSSQATMLAAVSVAFAGLEHEANATVTAAHTATAHKEARTARTAQRHTRLQRRRPVSETTTHVILAADHTAPSLGQTTTAPTATNAAVTGAGSEEHQQPDQTSSHAAAVSQPTTPAAGPTGLGRVPGSNCKPKCK